MNSMKRFPEGSGPDGELSQSRGTVVSRVAELAVSSARIAVTPFVGVFVEGLLAVNPPAIGSRIEAPVQEVALTEVSRAAAMLARIDQVVNPDPDLTKRQVPPFLVE